MKYITAAHLGAILAVRLQVLVMVSCLGLAVLGEMPDSSAGWVTCPPTGYLGPAARRLSRRRRGVDGRGPRRWQAAWHYVRHTWQVPLVRSVVLGMLWLNGHSPNWAWAVALPGVAWLWQGACVLWPALAHQPEWRLGRWLMALGQCWIGWVYLGSAWDRRLPALAAQTDFGPPLVWGLGCVVCGRGQPSVDLEANAEGGYTATICGHFTLRVADDDPFRKRLLALFLRQLEVKSEHRRSRRTRDGRTPFVRQQPLAKALGVPQPNLSVWERYWLDGDWRRLLSQHKGDVLTLELQQQIIETWARWPMWGVAPIHRLLVEQGVAVTDSQVEQAAHDSGWQIVRQALARLCVQRVDELRLRDEWLLGDLFAQIERLLVKLEAGQALTPEERLAVKALQAAGADAGLAARPPIQAQPWLVRVEQVLFGPGEAIADGSVRCLYCGSSDVGRKSRQARPKKFLDEQGQVPVVAVYRYYCHNPQCDQGSFTALPVGLVPYSPHRLEVHVLTLQLYAWSHSTYRLTARALDVTSKTAYRWVSAFGHDLLPVADLFGVLKSSGVVGIDEKWVKVPKNDKSAGQHRRWMYVYLAVDAYTYDLLHIALYPHNTAESAQAFLLALRAKGYHPQVIVTDLRVDYGPAIAHVFPRARHHEGLFHASQAVHRQLKEIYGTRASQTEPEVIALRQAIDKIVDAKTKRTAQRRYERVMAQRAKYVAVKPEVTTVFDSLETHWPKLLNGIESDLIPTTNNTVELVIRRFDQHYQNFCGFDTLASAHVFLGVFEKVYRFTPFSDDAQPRLRGKSPLELAGYDVANRPMAAVCRGWALAASTRPPDEVVPNG